MPRRLDARDPASRDAAIGRAAALLRAGSLVAFPTETVYGLGANARDAAAVARVYALKGRPRRHPLIVHLSDAEAMADWAAEVPGAAVSLAAAFWPGPLTLVLRARDDVPVSVTGGAATVALRVPGHPLALALLRALGEGVAAPSANRYGRVSPTCAEHVLAEFAGASRAAAEALVVLDGGPCAVGLESTIVDLSGSVARVLRPGAISERELAAVIGPLASPGATPRPPVPGDQARHYAPDVATRLVEAAELARVPDTVAVLARRGPPAERPLDAAPWLGLGYDASAYGRELYAALRVLEASHPRSIWIERVPGDEAWHAVADRLQRAASPADADGASPADADGVSPADADGACPAEADVASPASDPREEIA